MGTNLRILLCIFALISFFIILRLLKKNKIPVKYSIIWFFSAFIILLMSIIPDYMMKITSLIGFQAASNFVIGVILTLLLFITMALTIIVSEQKKQIKLLIQEVSLLKSKKEKNNEEK